jgi:hypothetical protein
VKALLSFDLELTVSLDAKGDANSRYGTLVLPVLLVSCGIENRERVEL